MQRYHHRGAFFIDEADDARAAPSGRAGGFAIALDRRRAAAATGEDRFDRAAMPAAMPAAARRRTARGTR